MGEKRKILLFIGPTSPPFGGVEAINDLLLDSYLKEKYSIIHLNTKKERGTEYNNRFDIQNIERALRHFYKLFVILITKKTDFAYLPISSTNSGFLRDGVFVIMLKLFRKPVVGHLHGGDFDLFFNKRSQFKKIFIKFILNKLKYLIVLSPFWEQFLSTILSNSGEKIKVVHNSINDDIYNYCLEKDYSKSSQIKVLFVGNLGKRKGVFDILKAIPEVIEKRQDIKFIFAGTEERLGRNAANTGNLRERKIAAVRGIFGRSIWK